MTVTVTVPDELGRRLDAAITARGATVEQLVVEALSTVDAIPVVATLSTVNVRPAVEATPVVDVSFAAFVSETVTEHDAIPHRHAET
jgi:hypothetical protein